MKAKTKFMKMFYKLPEPSRKGLMFFLARKEGMPVPATLSVINNEICHDTKIGKQILKDLGYEDD